MPKRNCKTIIEAKADYCLAIKGNQKGLYNEAQQFFNDCVFDGDIGSIIPTAYQETENKGHGRREYRRYWICSEIEWIDRVKNWPDLKSFGLAESRRIVKGIETIERRYFALGIVADAKRFADAVRGHWGIENSLHWVMDVTFNDDSSRMRKGYASENVSVLRHAAINLLKKENETKTSLRQKSRKCCMSEEYLLKVLVG